MPDQTVIDIRTLRQLNTGAYLTLAVVAIIGLLILPDLSMRVLVVALCIGFGLVDHFADPALGTRRRAHLYFATQTVLLTSLMVLASGSDIFGLLFLILAVQAVLTLPMRIAIVWIVLFYLIESGVALWYRGQSGIINVLFNAAVFVLTFVFANALRQAEIARQQNERLVAELQAAQRQIQDLAAAAERNRLARDLHDSVKQQVFATIMQLGAARVLLEREPHAAYAPVIEAEQLARQAGAELSLLIHELRPVSLDQRGLAETLRAYLNDWSRQSQIAIELRAGAGRPLAAAAEQALLRVVQEALANVARHSQATSVTVELSYNADAVALAIADNGRGFDTQTIQKGVGLASMRERLAELGGRLLIESRPGEGTRVTARCEGAYV
jgi:signal transduction histidine kinase